jgi:hypothetical protein
VTTPTPAPQGRLTLADVEPLARGLGTPRRSHDGRSYLDTPSGRLPLHRRGARTTVRDRLTAALAAKYPGRTASAAVLDQAAGQILTACAQADPDPAPALHVVTDGGSGTPWYDGLADLPDGWRCPVGWEISRGGILREGRISPETGEPGTPVRTAYGPVIVTATFTDPDCQKMADVAWLTDGGTWRSRTVPRLVTRSGKRLLATLGDEGLPVIEQDTKHVERWLAESERANRGVTPDQPIARWLGWQTDTSFLTSANDAVRYAVRDPRQDLAVQAHHPRGTLACWQEAIAEMKAWPVAQIILTAGFASPLLRILGLPSTILDIHYRSSRGKSIAAAAAFSVWGDPDIAAGGIAKWSDTSYALELRLAVARGLPVVVDESQNLGRKTPDAVTAFLYGIGNDRGTARGGDYLSSLAWSIILISTGERSLTTFGDAQGIAPRRIPVGVAPIPTAETSEDLEATRSAIRRFRLRLASNYGVAGPAFARMLIDALADGNDWLLSRHADLTAICQGGSDWTARRAPHVAALALAAELAEKWEILPFPRAPWHVWESTLLSEEAVEDEDQSTRAVDVITSALAETPEWIDYGDGRDQPEGGRWIAKVGIVTVGGEKRPSVLVPVPIAKQWITRSGGDFEAARMTWRDSGVLVPNDVVEGGRPVRRWTHKARIAGSSPTTMLAFHPDVIDPPMPPNRPTG